MSSRRGPPAYLPHELLLVLVDCASTYSSVSKAGIHSETYSFASSSSVTTLVHCRPDFLGALSALCQKAPRFPLAQKEPFYRFGGHFWL